MHPEFYQILTDTNVLHTIVEDFKASPLPIPVIIAAISFIIGVLTGLSQGHVAIVMPIVAALSPGDINLAGVAMAFGRSRTNANTYPYVLYRNAGLF